MGRRVRKRYVKPTPVRKAQKKMTLTDYEQKQMSELGYWKSTNPKKEAAWFAHYDPLKSIVSILGDGLTAVDIGCGAAPVSLTFPNIGRITLVDPLVQEYAKMPWATVGQAAESFASLDDVPTDRRWWDVAFVLNCLDHMPEEMALSMLWTLDERIGKVICGYVDYRNHGDQYHYVWTRDIGEHLPHFSLVYQSTIERGGFYGRLFAYTRIIPRNHL